MARAIGKSDGQVLYWQGQLDEKDERNMDCQGSVRRKRMFVPE